MRRWSLSLLALAVPRLAAATPSTTMWAPSTAAVQPFGVLHGTYDTYLGTNAAYPLDLGLTMGVLPWTQVQAEVGLDVLYPTFAGTDALEVPLLANAKIGTPEDAFFRGQPSFSFGIYALGFEEDVTDYDLLHAMLGRTFPYVGTVAAGGYVGLNPDLLVGSDGDTHRAGLMVGWTSPAIDVPVIDKLLVAADVQTGENVQGAVGAGVYVYFTPAIDLLLGPVIFLDPDLQPGGSSWMWSVQLDVDVALVE